MYASVCFRAQADAYGCQHRIMCSCQLCVVVLWSCGLVGLLFENSEGSQIGGSGVHRQGFTWLSDAVT